MKIPDDVEIKTKQPLQDASQTTTLHCGNRIIGILERQFAHLLRVGDELNDQLHFSSWERIERKKKYGYLFKSFI